MFLLLAPALLTGKRPGLYCPGGRRSQDAPKGPKGEVRGWMWGMIKNFPPLKNKTFKLVIFPSLVTPSFIGNPSHFQEFRESKSALGGRTLWLSNLITFSSLFMCRAPYPFPPFFSLNIFISSLSVAICFIERTRYRHIPVETWESSLTCNVGIIHIIKEKNGQERSGWITVSTTECYTSTTDRAKMLAETISACRTYSICWSFAVTFNAAAYKQPYKCCICGLIRYVISLLQAFMVLKQRHPAATIETPCNPLGTTHKPTAGVYHFVFFGAFLTSMQYFLWIRTFIFKTCERYVFYCRWT